MSSVGDMQEVGLGVRIKLASPGPEMDAIRALRRAVFCDEQGIFHGDDGDDIDPHALHIAAVLGMPGEPDAVVGTVRIHQAEPGVWYGSRLAVACQVRRIGSVGGGLIRLAVGSAHARGCHTFLAQVQSQNVALFEHLHWSSLAAMDLHGRPHQLMKADLDFYPPVADGATGLLLSRSAA